MKIIIALTALLLIFAYSAEAQKACTRSVETAGHFSFCPPENWTDKGKPGTPYKKYFGPVIDGFGANVNFKEEISSASLADYVKSAVDVALAGREEMGLTSLLVESKTPFVTTSGVTGIRVIFAVELKNLKLTTIQYIFAASPRRKLAATWTLPVSQREAVLPLAQTSMKSFRIEK